MPSAVSAPRRALLKKLPKADEQVLVIEKKSDSRAVFFEWLDTLGRSLELNDEDWLLDATRMYLERREPKTNWDEVFDELRAARRPRRTPAAPAAAAAPAASEHTAASS